MKQALVLRGGKGTRLGPLTRKTPKPLVNVCGKPFLEHLLLKLVRYGFDKIILSAGYLGDQIHKYFHGRQIYGVKIEVVIEDKPLGTGGAILNILEKLDDKFMVLNGDTFFDVNFNDVKHYSLSKKINKMNVIVTRFIKTDGRYGYLELNEDNTVAKFREKKSSSKLEHVNAGIYIFNKKDLLSLKSEYVDKVSLEEQILPRLVTQKLLIAKTYRDQDYFVDIGLPETLQYFNDTFFKIINKPALILDRDNTINFDEGYTYDPKDLRLLPDVTETIKKVNDAGYYVFVATNQSGIGRGYYSLNDVHKFHDCIRKILLGDGAHIDAFEICPHIPSDSCDCRKPSTLMLQRLHSDYQFDVARSIMIGDKMSMLNVVKILESLAKVHKENSLRKIVEDWMMNVCK